MQSAGGGLNSVKSPPPSLPIFIKISGKVYTNISKASFLNDSAHIVPNDSAYCLRFTI